MKARIQQAFARLPAGGDPIQGTHLIDSLTTTAHQVKVVIAILGDWRGLSLRNLPLVSKLELRELYGDLARMGFEMEVALVPLSVRGEEPELVRSASAPGSRWSEHPYQSVRGGSLDC